MQSSSSARPLPADLAGFENCPDGRKGRAACGRSDARAQHSQWMELVGLVLRVPRRSHRAARGSRGRRHAGRIVISRNRDVPRAKAQGAEGRGRALIFLEVVAVTRRGAPARGLGGPRGRGIREVAVRGLQFALPSLDIGEVGPDVGERGLDLRDLRPQLLAHPKRGSEGLSAVVGRLVESLDIVGDFVDALGQLGEFSRASVARVADGLDVLRESVCAPLQVPDALGKLVDNVDCRTALDGLAEVVEVVGVVGPRR